MQIFLKFELNQLKNKIWGDILFLNWLIQHEILHDIIFFCHINSSAWYFSDFELNYLSFRFWIGMWMCAQLLIVVMFDLSALVR